MPWSVAMAKPALVEAKTLRETPSFPGTISYLFIPFHDTRNRTLFQMKKARLAGLLALATPLAEQRLVLPGQRLARPELPFDPPLEHFPADDGRDDQGKNDHWLLLCRLCIPAFSVGGKGPAVY